MSTGKQTEINAAFCAAIKVLNERYLSTLLVRWPNRPITPEGGKPYLTVDIITNKAMPKTLGVYGEDEITGFLQVGLHYPQGEGYFDLTEAVEIFRKFFIAGVYIKYKGAIIQITSSAETDPINEDGRWKVHFTAFWMTRINRDVQTASLILSNLDSLAS